MIDNVLLGLYLC